MKYAGLAGWPGLGSASSMPSVPGLQAYTDLYGGLGLCALALAGHGKHVTFLEPGGTLFRGHVFTITFPFTF